MDARDRVARRHVTITVAAGLVALLLAVAGAAAPASAGETSDKNQPAYWAGLGYGTCEKVEGPGTPYELGAAPAGSAWSLLVVKAGSESSTYDPHAEYHNPPAGAYHHPSGKAISHIIRCHRPGAGTTTTVTPTTIKDCGSYAPSRLALDQASAEPGQTVTITGVAGGSDTLTFAISGTGVSTVDLGSVVTDPDGSFAKDLVIPDAYPAGTYTIKVRSARCNLTRSITIVTQSVDRSGCGSGNPLVLVRGAATSWKLISGTPPFNQSKPIKLTLVRRDAGAASTVLYSGAWPAGGTRTITVPAATPADRYFLIQSGSQQGNNRARSESCPIRVAEQSAPIGNVRAQDGGVDDGVRVALGLTFGAAVLVGLRQSRRTTRRRRHASSHLR
ncbi:MAG TPA: hypothetical protein VHK88_16545 [Aquihabitans sp.]|jgi:hypothetical protein|nr:hypothetical protein [Aquihabitans sp.]